VVTSCIFVYFCVSTCVVVLSTDGDGRGQCCFTFFEKRIPRRHVTSYYMTDPECPVVAVVYVLPEVFMCLKVKIKDLQRHQTFSNSHNIVQIPLNFS
uniref:Chemokine interleukin-8-like domain-containing protein n=1 Tax=Sphaeramia orbicularis TaxID=375764 RepID=A0A673B693_9TELE